MFLQAFGEQGDLERVTRLLQRLQRQFRGFGFADLSQHVQQADPQRRIAHLLSGADRVKIDVLETVEKFADGRHRCPALFGELLERAFQFFDLLGRHAAGKQVRPGQSRHQVLRHPRGARSMRLSRGRHRIGLRQSGWVGGDDHHVRKRRGPDDRRHHASFLRQNRRLRGRHGGRRRS